MKTPLFLFVAATLAACVTASSSKPAAESLKGSRLTIVANTLDGDAVDIAAQGRGKVRVVDFWATWCDPCREEIPFLERMRADLASQGFAVYAISVDEDRDQIPAFLKESPVHFTVMWDKGAKKFGGPYQLERLPTTLIVDRKGYVRFVHQGWDKGTGEEELAQVKQLLAE